MLSDEAGGEVEERTLELTLTNKFDAPRQARAALHDLRVEPAVLAKLRLLVTELVANGHKHGRGETLHVMISVTAGAVRAEVSDEGPGFSPPAPDRNPLKSEGWGLLLVRRMAARWGIAAGRALVWFEIDRGEAGFGPLAPHRRNRPDVEAL